MKCFSHSTKDGLGICKNCFKSVCEDCFQEIEGILCCKGGGCQKSILKEIEMEEHSEELCTAGVEKTYKLSVIEIMYVGVGLIACGYGAFYLFFENDDSDFYGILPLSYGVLLLVLGLNRLFRKAKMTFSRSSQ